MKEKIKKSLPNLVALGTSISIMLLMFFSGIGQYASTDGGITYRLVRIISVWDCGINSLQNSLGYAFARLLIISIFVLLLIFILSLVLLLKDLNVIKKDFGEINYPRILRILAIIYTCITFLNMFLLIGACGDMFPIMVVKIRFMPIFLWIVGLALVVFLYLDKIIYLFNKIKNKTIKVNDLAQEEVPEQEDEEPEEEKNEEPVAEHEEPQVMPKGPKIAPPINRNPNLNEGAPIIPHKKPNTEN